MNNFRQFKMFKIIDRTINLFILFVFILALSSCATVNSTSISRDEIPTLSENKARIYFYRPSLFFGSGMKPPIFLSGNKVGISSSGTAFYVDVAPGKYNVSVDKILYPGDVGSVDFEVLGNEIVYVKTWIGGSSLAGITNFNLVSPETAEKEIKDLRFLRFNLAD
ncbi:MAG: DUF2846 domain-containing protein [Desulfocapsaceae bacterium]|nr:DUF2846 domain-containing protein [Desulfocapsaceae bacterium]